MNWKKWGVITWVFIIFGIPTLILIIYVAYDITTNENTNQLYSVTLDGKAIHSDQGLTSLVFRAINGSQYVEVYGIVNQTPISFTRLVDDGGNVITTDKSFKIKSNSPSTLIEVSINNKGPGLFEGWLVTKDKNNATISIPLKLATEPLLKDSILLVLIGVGLSICMWELIMRAINGRKKEKKKDLTSLIGTVQYEANKAKKVTNKALQKSQTLSEMMSNDMYPNQRLYYEEENKEISTKIIEPTIDYFSSKVKALQLEEISIQPQIIRTDIRLNRYEKRNKSGIKSAARLFLIGLAPSLLGIFIALFTILNDQTVTGAIVLDPTSIAKLIGLGLATGSLKQFFDQT